MKFPRVWGNGIPIKIATKSNTEKSGMTILYYLVDLALEKSNPLTTHIVLGWKYSIEWYFLNIFELQTYNEESNVRYFFFDSILHTCFRIGDWHLDAILSDFDVLIEKNLIFCGKLPGSVPYVRPYSLTSFA